MSVGMVGRHSTLVCSVFTFPAISGARIVITTITTSKPGTPSVPIKESILFNIFYCCSGGGVDGCAEMCGLSGSCLE